MLILRILALVFGVIFILCGGCTVLVWGGLGLSSGLDVFAVTMVGVGAAALAAGVLLIRFARRAAAGPHDPPDAG
jgi:hypothetical protein